MTSLVGRVYRHRYAPFAAFCFVVAMGAYGLWSVERQQDALTAEQQSRTAAQCQGAIGNRATQLISNQSQILFGEILISVSTEGGDVDPARQRRIDRFRESLEEHVQVLDDRALGRLPASCDGIMTLSEFRERVRAQADDAFTPAAAAALLR